MRDAVSDFGDIWRALSDAGIDIIRANNAVDGIKTLAARLAEAEAAAKTWENEAERRSRRYEQAAVRLAEAIATLQSIASNSCCGSCNEAALVARAFLRPADSADVGQVAR